MHSIAVIDYNHEIFGVVNSVLLSSEVITANHTKLRQANNEWDFWAARVLGYDMGKHDVSAKIRKFYFGNAADIGSIEFLPNFTRLFSDRQFFVPIHRFAQQFGKFADTRMYLYTYEAEFCFADILAATQSEWVPPLISVIWEVAKRWICLKFGYDIPHLGICHGAHYFYLTVKGGKSRSLTNLLQYLF